MFGRKSLKTRVKELEQQNIALKAANVGKISKQHTPLGHKGWTDATDKDPMSELEPPSGLTKFRNMRLNDPIIGGLMLRLENVFKHADWEIVGPNTSLISSQLESLPYGMASLISDMTSSFVFGFSLNEKVWQAKNGKIVLKDVEPRYQTTIDDFRDDKAIQRWSGGSAEIPIAKCVHFVPIEHCRNPYGESFLRQVYKPYYYKSSIEAAEALGIDRDLGGLPVLTAPEGFDFNKADTDSPSYDASYAATLTWANTLVGDVRRDHVEGVVKPYGWELEILRGETRTTIPTVEIINRYNTEIAVGLLQTFAVLGGFASTNNTNVTELVEDFHFICNAFLQMIARTIERQLIRDICILNDKTTTPTFRFKDVQRRDIDKLASFVVRLVKEGVIDPTITLEKSMLEKINVPYTADNEKDLKERLNQSKPPNNITNE
jgi:hypothetical protein